MNYKEIFKTFILSACTVMMAGCSSTVILESERFMSAFRKDVPFALDSLTQIGEGKYGPRGIVRDGQMPLPNQRT